MLRRLIILLLLALPLPSKAQVAATLVADQVQISGNSTLIAQGHIEVLYGTTRLKASRIVFNNATGQLQIEGPITITEGDSVLILASSAELSSDLRNGILRGARMVLDQQLQLAANKIHRVDGRYTQLYKTVASSCQVCDANPVPLWQIRARRIIHDQLERQLYFDDAVLQVAGVSVFYLPRLRLPDPTLKRATGFLIPKFRSNSKLGWGLKTPYFIRIGDHADLTVTPFLTTKTRTLELAFRRAFRRGDISFEGAVSRDDIRPNDTRSYFFGEARFELPRDYVLNFDIETTTDRDYLVEYGYSNKDRLDSAISISRARRNKLVIAELTHFHSLRASESNLTQPTLVGDLTYHQRFRPAFLGGDLEFKFDAHSHYRRSPTIGNDGRDLARASMRLNWARTWEFRNGMIGRIAGQINVDHYAIKQGFAGEFSGTHVTPAASVELRWPWVKASTKSGASHVIEPVVQFVWTEKNAENIPNEDSRLVEFDEGNLFSMSRFPGADVYERGLRANVGVSWTRYDPSGWSLGVTVGRVLRADDLGQFAAGTGLSGKNSNWLAAVQLKFANNLAFTNRAVFDDNLTFAKNETRLTWQSSRWGIGTSYIWMEAEPFENRPSRTSEWTFDAAYKFTPHWTGKTDWRYDFNDNSAAYGGIGLEYHNECVKIDLSLSRRFTSSGSLKPTTDFGLTVALSGFGSGGSNRATARNCQR